MFEKFGNDFLVHFVSKSLQSAHCPQNLAEQYCQKLQVFYFFFWHAELNFSKDGDRTICSESTVWRTGESREHCVGILLFFWRAGLWIKPPWVQANRMDNLLLLTFPSIVLAFISRVVILKRWNHFTSHLLKIWDVNRMEAWCLDSISLRWDQSLYCCLFASCCNQLSWLNNFVNRYVSQCICYTYLIASCFLLHDSLL